MRYEIQHDRAAIKGKRGIHPTAVKAIDAAIQGLAEDPRPEAAKPLTGPLKGHYRLSVVSVGGHYRVLYSIDDKAHVVTVESIGSREGFY
jgi:mRNA interferase RelE/StbE